MAKHLIVTIPDDAALRQQIEQEIAEYADVRQAQRYADLETIKLVLEVVGTGIGIAANVAAILTFLQVAKMQREEQGLPTPMTASVPGHDETPVDQADAELLARLLEE